MALAAAVNVALALALRSLWLRRSGLGGYGAALAALAAIWSVNFLIILPQASPDFVVLLPYQVTLASKLFFGLAAAWGLRRQTRSAAEALIEIEEKTDAF